jgi:hypothetical protein
MQAGSGVDPRYTGEAVTHDMTLLAGYANWVKWTVRTCRY